MEERTSTGFPSGTGSSGLERFESTERGDMADKARHFASEGAERARHFGELARERLMKTANQRKGHLAAELESFAGTLDEMARTLEDRGNEPQHKIAQGASQWVRRASKTLRENSAEELVDQAEDQLRARPALAVVGGLALGFLGVRMLRS